MSSSKWLILIMPFLVALCGTDALAFPDTAGCRTCHPNFQGGPGNALHDLHVGTAQMTNNCRLCHSSFFNAPVDINESLDGVSCIGCHLSRGLWERHQASGISCAPCHTNWPTPDPENTNPPYYGRTDVLLTDPCERNPQQGGEDFDNDGRGLDNDGDTLYDGDDPDCGPIPVEEDTWGSIKTLF